MYFGRMMREMFDLLGCSDVDLRIQAGEAVALLYEAARIHDEDYSWNREGELCSALKGEYCMFILHSYNWNTHNFIPC